MPWRAPLRFAGVPLHIIQRGNNHIACFFAAQNYRLYLYHLKKLAQRFACGVHAEAMKEASDRYMVNLRTCSAKDG